MAYEIVITGINSVGDVAYTDDYGNFSTNDTWGVLFQASDFYFIRSISWFFLIEDPGSVKVNFFIQQWTGSTAIDYLGRTFTGDKLWDVTKSISLTISPMAAVQQYTFSVNTLLSAGIYGLGTYHTGGNDLRVGYVAGANPNGVTAGLSNMGGKYQCL